MKASLDNKSVCTRKGNTLPDAAFHQERATPSCYEIGCRCIVSWATHTCTNKKNKKISKSLFVMLQRWNGQAWAVTLDPPWLRSLLTRTWGSSVSRHRCCPNVRANAHLASVASAKRSLAGSQPQPRSVPKPPAAFSCESVCRQIILKVIDWVLLRKNAPREFSWRTPNGELMPLWGTSFTYCQNLWYVATRLQRETGGWNRLNVPISLI